MAKFEVAPAAEVSPRTLAEELFTIGEQKAFLEEREQEIRAELLGNLKTQGVDFVRLSNGIGYSVAERNNLIIKNEMAAEKWARENPESRMSLNKSAALKVAKMGKSKIFGIEKIHYLKITRPKTVEE